MRAYEKPLILKAEELSEGVYMASGSDCYTTTVWIHQIPEQGRYNTTVQLNAKHAAADGHHSGEQIAVLTFNAPVQYVASNGTLVSGDGTNVLTIRYAYHNNGNDNIGLGNVYVTSDVELAAPLFELQCNYDCGQH